MADNLINHYLSAYPEVSAIQKYKGTKIEIQQIQNRWEIISYLKIQQTTFEKYEV